MRKHFITLLFCSFSFVNLAQVNAYSVFMGNLSNPAYHPYGNNNVVALSNEVFAAQKIPFIYSAISYSSQIKGLNFSVNNFMGFYENYFNSYLQSICLSKTLETKYGNFSPGIGLSISNSRLKEKILVQDDFATQFGYTLNLGIVYQYKDHILGISANNVLDRASLLIDNEQIKIAKILNLRYQTTFIFDEIQIQPFLIKNGVIGTPIRNWYFDHYTIGLSAKYKSLKAGVMFLNDRGEHAMGYNIGYDFENFSIQYSLLPINLWAGDSPSTPYVSHNITFKFSPSGFAQSKQIF